MADVAEPARRWILLAETMGALVGPLTAVGHVIACRSRRELSDALRGVFGGEIAAHLLVIDERLLGPRRLEILEALSYAGLQRGVIFLGAPRSLTERERSLGVLCRLDRHAPPTKVVRAVARHFRHAVLAPPRSGVFSCLPDELTSECPAESAGAPAADRRRRGVRAG